MVFCKINLLAVLLALVSCVPVPSQEVRLHPKNKVIHAHVLNHVNTVVFTPQTVFSLDGTNCNYDQVPQTAVITAIEFSPDGRTVTKVHFKKPPRTRP